MPTLLDVLMDPVTLTVISLYLILMLWEAVFPARSLPVVRGWRLRAIASFAGYLLVSAYLPLLWAEWVPSLRVFDLRHLDTWSGALVGLLVYEAGAWCWHRSLHGSDLLWRWFHQWHHSAERLDVPGAFWFSPLDMIGWTTLSSLCLTVVVGLSPSATYAAVAIITFLAVFQHTNVRTPRWLGYLVQRPESHSWHHARGVHSGNYADLPLFDLLGGTLRNPVDFAPAQGLTDEGSRRMGDMLLGREVAPGSLATGASRAVIR